MHGGELSALTNFMTKVLESIERINKLSKLSERYLTKEQESDISADPTSASSVETHDDEEEESTETKILLDVVEGNLLNALDVLGLLIRPEHEAAVKAELGDGVSIKDQMAAIGGVLQAIGADLEDDEDEEESEEEDSESEKEKEPKEDEKEKDDGKEKADAEKKPEEPAAPGEGEKKPEEEPAV